MKFKQFKIIELCDVKSGKRLPKGKDFVPESNAFNRYIRARNVKCGKINSDDIPYIDEETFLQLKRYAIHEGDIAITIVANIGDVGICSSEMDGYILTENCAKLTNFKECVNPKYLNYYLSQPFMKEYMFNRSVGAAQAKLGISKLSKISVQLPPLEEQEKIVDIIENYDLIVENNNKRIAILEQIAQEIYKEWFVRFRFPGYEDILFINGIPNGWKEMMLADYADIVMGQSPKSCYYNEVREGLPFHQGVSSFGDIFLIDDIYSTNGLKIAEPFSVIFSVRAPVGRININLNKIILGRGVCSINAKYGSNDYLYWNLKNKFVKEDIIGNGAIFSSVTKDEISKQKILIPTELILHKFEELVKPLEKEILVLYKKNLNLIRQRDLLLPRLMSGKLEVK